MRAQLPQNCAGYGIVIAGEMAVDEMWVRSKKVCWQVVARWPPSAGLVRFAGCPERCLPLLKLHLAPKVTLAP